jgi:hypothetical protein
MRVEQEGDVESPCRFGPEHGRDVQPDAATREAGMLQAACIDEDRRLHRDDEIG